MNSKPMIFTGDSMLALLNTREDGTAIDPTKPTKTQTRRIIKPQPDAEVHLGPDGRWWFWKGGVQHTPIRLKCPHPPGSRVYTSERVETLEIDNDAARIRYVADGTVAWVPIPDRIKPPKVGPYRGRVIPIEWSRLFEEIKAVRAERVQEISEADAEAEGIGPDYDDWLDEVKNVAPPESGFESRRDWFARLWNSINTNHPWVSNPFVFVYDVRRVEGDER